MDATDAVDASGSEAERRPAIRFAWLIPSYACNKRCDFCYNGEDYLADKSRASGDTASRMIEALGQFAIEHVTILGGEPLIYPQLERLVERAGATGAKVSIVTNGALFVTRPEQLRWLASAGVAQILVSLEPPASEAPGPADRRSARRRLAVVS